MTSRLHFGVINVVMEQWFSLMGIEDEEQIWLILTKNRFAMNKLKQNANAGTMVLSDMLTEWELGIGALQSKIIRRFAKYCEEELKNPNKNEANVDADANANESSNGKQEQQ